MVRVANGAARGWPKRRMRRGRTISPYTASMLLTRVLVLLLEVGGGASVSVPHRFEECEAFLSDGVVCGE